MIKKCLKQCRETERKKKEQGWKKTIIKNGRSKERWKRKRRNKGRRLKEKEKDIEVGTIDNWRKSLRKGER